ncbi:hypothetical protein LUZ60_015357 [Juncus effusus]|nr:hypothetical protein LUZ60_015357 [Juncus effusus]
MIAGVAVVELKTRQFLPFQSSHVRDSHIGSHHLRCSCFLELLLDLQFARLGHRAIALTITEVEDLKKMSKEDAARHEQEKRKLLSKIKQLEDLQPINEQQCNDMKEYLKKEKEILCQENEQLKQHISILKYDSELARLDKAALATIKDQIQDERDNAVKEAEKLRNQIKLARTSNFTWQELKNSTLDFSASLKIGEGGYGRVYKGNLRGTDVAIKILNSEKTAPLSAFKQEVAILTTFRHPNLVTLIGACYEHSALVYEFLPNGSLENHLNPANNITPLTWQVRTRIMHEICLALIFLHSNKPNIVIHGDLKPDNVLLDANFVSKLGDFGISRLITQSETDNTACYMTDNIVGTPGYMDPDFVYNGQLTEKSDVFSFGVIILRLLTGQSARGVVSRVQDAMQSETLDKMTDKSAGEWPFDQAKKLAVLGLGCTEMSRSARPNLFNEVWPIIESLRRM